MAQCYIRLKKFDKAEQAFLQGIKEYPQDLYFYGNYGDLLIRIKRDTAGALALYRQARGQAPETATGYLFQSASLFYENRIDSAIKMLYKALEYDPGNIDALGQIAQVEFQNKNFEQSIKMATKVCEIAKNQAKGNQDLKYRIQTMYNYIAMAHYNQLRYDSAMYYARCAIALDTNVAYPYTTLAESYAFLGQKEQFYRNVGKAVSKGFEYTPETVNQEPYTRFAKDPRFQKVANYKPLKN